MIHDLYQHLPQHIDPVAFSIGFFALRWYAVSYIVGFGVVYFILMWRIRHGDFLENKNPKSKCQISNKIQNTENDLKIRNTLIDFLLVIFFAALVGGRIGYVLFYNLSYFLAHPLAIVSPYVDGKLVGIYGMSYHGALVGAILACWIFTRIKKIDFWAWADFVIVAVPAGYFFGRIGNFFNGELYGRITSSSIGMYFASDPNNLRYPSQLIEACLEGILLFVILWKMKSSKLVRQLEQGSLLAIYLIGYGVARIVGEQFREPDPQLGFLFGHFTMGQLLSMAMVVAGLIIFTSKNNKSVLNWKHGKDDF